MLKIPFEMKMKKKENWGFLPFSSVLDSIHSSIYECKQMDEELSERIVLIFLNLVGLCIL